MLNCWRVNESSCTVVITEFLIKTLSAVFAAKRLLELGGDECDNMNFMNFKIDSFKTRKNSWILGTVKIHEIRTLNLWLIVCSICNGCAAFWRSKEQ